MIGTDYHIRTRNILKATGALVEGDHFVYSSGRHGDYYLNGAAVYVYPKKLDDISVMMADVALNTFHSIDVVLAPAISGIILGQCIAYNLDMEVGDIKFAIADKNVFDNNRRSIRRGYESIVKGKKVLLVDSVINSGNTLNSMSQSALSLGADVVGAVVICDRRPSNALRFANDANTKDFDIEVSSLVELDLQTFEASTCPLCRSGRPINTLIGEGANVEYLRKLNKDIDERNKDCTTYY